MVPHGALWMAHAEPSSAPAPALPARLGPKSSGSSAGREPEHFGRARRPPTTESKLPRGFTGTPSTPQGVRAKVKELVVFREEAEWRSS